MVKNILLVGCGGFLGAILRYVINLIVLNNLFPYATLVVNGVGSFLIGLSLHYATGSARLFFIVGVLGSFTTFSAFSAETFLMLNKGAYGMAMLNIFLNVAVCITAVACSFFLFKRWF